MAYDFLKVELKDPNGTFEEFYELLDKSGIYNNYEVFQVPLPVDEFADEFLEHVSNHGFESLFNYTISMEDITSPSMTINKVEEIVHKFVMNLDASERLLIIDPYFYASSNTTNTVDMFSRLLSSVSTNLKEVTIVTNGRKVDTKAAIHTAIKSIQQNITINDFSTDEFHDRFWLDPDRSIGIVMGTSLNGLGNKISLIDKLSEQDVTEIVKLAKNLNVLS
ncbi:hypothetical protein [Pseudoalteromonas spongiae]|uniref:hypothetical protein n=1 Tax=Pseudoalteromonas spongiae TaxID=298657 RepID=UPI00110A9BB0|nr:hypothetical protein [Pseudoalteromonas spongiae]TMO83307.1 hypothetical protein CWC15_15130 [Pseudoalteromonas spongiae]